MGGVASGMEGQEIERVSGGETMKFTDPSKMIAEAIVLADETAKLIRGAVSNPTGAIEAMELAANKANALQHLCTKTKRAIKEWGIK